MANRYERPKGSEIPITIEERPNPGAELYEKKIEVAASGNLDIDPNFDARVDNPAHTGLPGTVCRVITAAPKKVTLTVGEHGSVTIKIAGVVVSSLPETVPYDTLVEFDAVPAAGYVVDAWSGLPQGTQSSGNDRWFSMGHEPVNVFVTFKSAAVYDLTVLNIVYGEQAYDITEAAGATELFVNPKQTIKVHLSGTIRSTWSFDFDGNMTYISGSNVFGALIDVTGVGDVQSYIAVYNNRVYFQMNL